MIFQYPGIGDSKSVKQAWDMDIPEIWKHSPRINPYPGNGGNKCVMIWPERYFLEPVLVGIDVYYGVVYLVQKHSILEHSRIIVIQVLQTTIEFSLNEVVWMPFCLA